MTLFAQWFEDNEGERISLALSNGFATTGICDGANADGTGAFVRVGAKLSPRLFNLAHIISVGIERD